MNTGIPIPGYEPLQRKRAVRAKGTDREGRTASNDEPNDGTGFDRDAKEGEISGRGYC
jgi:hypothetical protein